MVVIAPDGATFLFRYNDVEVGRHWAPPGGGVEPGETYREAARRELEEETGWSDLDLGDFLFAWEHDYTRWQEPVRQYEELFSAFGPRREPIGDLHDAHSSDKILEWRWWSPEELRATREEMWPPALADLVARVVAD